MAAILQQIIESGHSIAIEDLRATGNRALTEAIQTCLCRLGLLDPVIGGDKQTPFRPISFADGAAGPETRNAIAAFHRHARLPEPEGLLRPAFFSALIASDPEHFFPLRLDPQPGDSKQVQFAKRILRYKQKKDFWIARAPDMFNIVYVEGVEPYGEPNRNALNFWDDRRCVIRILPGGQPEMLVNDQATTEPGHFYTMNPMNRFGAARMAFGQYKAWRDGLHRGAQPSLVQRGPVRLHRDMNKNGVRDADDPIEIGSGFGINQHSTRQGLEPAQVGQWSAGCLVGRRYPWHLHFMHIVRQDFRFVHHPAYMFMTTVIDGHDLAKVEPL
jgi:hypothetical protein